MISIGELVASDFEKTMMLEPRADLDGAIIGVVEDGGEYRVVYDLDKLTKAFMDMNHWGLDTAIEWMDFNVIPGHLGPGTPIFMDPIKPH